MGSLRNSFFFLLGRTIKVLLDFENTITDKAKPVIGYLITKKTQFLPQLSVTCLRCLKTSKNIFKLLVLKNCTFRDVFLYLIS